MHHIFLSYSRKDSAIVRRVMRSLQVAGLQVWTDEGIEPGTEAWHDIIDKAIKATKVLVCISSPASKDSRWVKAELARAELAQKPVFLILANGDERDSIPFGYESQPFIDIRRNENYEQEVQNLITILRQKLDLDKEKRDIMPDIFLSYSRKDGEIMRRVKRSLLSAGLKVWTDEGIEPGTSSWKRAIEQALIDTKYLVCLASPDSKKSEWVEEELTVAKLHAKSIFLILVSGDEKNAIPFGFSTHQFIDIRKSENYEAQIRT